MVWLGRAWQGEAWFGAVWHGSAVFMPHSTPLLPSSVLVFAWFGLARDGAARRGLVRLGAAGQGAAR